MFVMLLLICDILTCFCINGSNDDHLFKIYENMSQTSFCTSCGNRTSSPALFRETVSKYDTSCFAPLPSMPSIFGGTPPFRSLNQSQCISITCWYVDLGGVAAEPGGVFSFPVFCETGSSPVKPSLRGLTESPWLISSCLLLVFSSVGFSVDGFPVDGLSVNGFPVNGVSCT